MKKVFLVLSLASFLMVITFLPTFASHTRVNGYYKSNGTYVNGYSRTSPNSTRLDNFSTKGNLNPYTSKTGTVNPYKNYSPTSSSRSYRTYKLK